MFGQHTLSSGHTHAYLSLSVCAWKNNIHTKQKARTNFRSTNFGRAVLELRNERTHGRTHTRPGGSLLLNFGLAIKNHITCLRLTRIQYEMRVTYYVMFTQQVCCPCACSCVCVCVRVPRMHGCACMCGVWHMCVCSSIARWRNVHVCGTRQLPRSLDNR